MSCLESNGKFNLNGACRYGVTALWLISNYFGKQQPMTQCGHLVGHVRTDGGRLAKLSNCAPVAQGYHADNSDIVMLACRTPAKSGGNVGVDNVGVDNVAVDNWVVKIRA